MDKKILLILLGVIVLAIIITIIAIVRNNRKAALKKEIEDVIVRYNAVKTIPLAYKLNKAQAMAKRNEAASEKIKDCYDKYVEAQKQIDQIGEIIEEVEDNLASKNIRQAKDGLESIRNIIDDCERDVNSIDDFLDRFSQKETNQREYSARLKEEYGEIKNKINNSSAHLSIAYDGMLKKLEKCEELFSQSEEWMYASDYELAQEVLDKISVSIKDIERAYEVLPKLVEDAKGVIPVLFDEATRQFSLCKQRGVYLDDLSISSQLDGISNSLNKCSKTLQNAEFIGVEESINQIKEDLNDLLAEINNENQSYTDAKALFENTKANINSIKTLYAYVESLYTTQNEHYDMSEVGDYLETLRTNLTDYQADVITLSGDLASSLKPASGIRSNLGMLFENTQKDLDKISDYKKLIDKNTSDEERARTQLIKLQVVLNEIEVKVLEYHLPTIASNYKDDLLAGRERIALIKDILRRTPLDIDELNTTLDEAITFIYTFFNNVNNIVSMAVMVENAIVFGNKYRSSSIEIDRDLSKSELSFMNGEYTKALKIAIECMETLFPNAVNEKIMENN